MKHKNPNKKKEKRLVIRYSVAFFSSHSHEPGQLLAINNYYPVRVGLMNSETDYAGYKSSVQRNENEDEEKKTN